MMLAIIVEFLHGTYRADPDGSAISGRAEFGEWPPSVARLLAAFVAADTTSDDCHIIDIPELQLLENLEPPIIYAEANPLHQPLRERYVVLASKKIAQKTHQNYPAKTAALVRPGVRVALRIPTVIYAWESNGTRKQIDKLQRRATRIGYLGCADSPVRVRVTSTLTDIRPADMHTFKPYARGTCMVSVPRPGQHLAALEAAYEAWQEHGASISRSQFPALRNLVAYAGPDDVTSENEAGQVVGWLRLRPAIPGRRLADMTAALKAAVMSKYQRLYGDPLPRELHGHGFGTAGFEIARYLALPDVGYEHSDGRIHGAAVWLPRTCSDTIMERTQAATHSIEQLSVAGLDLKVMPWGGEHRPRAATPRRWQERSRVWVTAVPAIHERFGNLALAEVKRWCHHAGLPEPVEFLHTRVPLVPGALSLQPAEIRRPLRDNSAVAKPYSHFKICFSELVRGPVVIGSGRSRGFGLCIPLRETVDTTAKHKQD